jgi:hypothetical protein
VTVDANIPIFVAHHVETCGTTTAPLSTGLVSPPLLDVLTFSFRSLPGSLYDSQVPFDAKFLCSAIESAGVKGVSSGL